MNEEQTEDTNPVVQAIVESPTALTNLVGQVMAEIDGVEIVTRVDAEYAAVLLTRKVVPLQATAELVKKAAHEQHHRACNADQALTTARRDLERKIIDWRDAQQQREAAAAIEKAAEQIAAADTTKLAQAAHLEQQGRDAEAQAVLASPTLMPVPQAASVELPDVQVRDSWAVDVFDFGALAKAAVDPEQPAVPLEAILPNAKLLGQQVRSLKASFAWPGCRAVNTPRVRS